MIATKTNTARRRTVGNCALEYALALSVLVLGSIAGLRSMHVELIASVAHLGDTLAANVPVR